MHVDHVLCMWIIFSLHVDQVICMWITLQFREESIKMVDNRDGRFGSKVGQMCPKWDKSGAFSDQISVHLAPRAKCTEI